MINANPPPASLAVSGFIRYDEVALSLDFPMPKTTLSFNPAEYALVADRISLFYEQYPAGRILTRMISRDRDVVFRAAVYRLAEDRIPAATGWASEREGDGDINMVACVENTETSAIGRALANLGFTASRK